MSEPDAPIGLYGGTFDPVHCGHLRVALEAADALGLEQVRLLPVNVPGHRAPPVASVSDRCDMLEAAAQRPLIVDRSEIERGGVSYTVDTLEALRAQYPRRSLCLILGLDAYQGLPSWHRPHDILALAHIVVAMRPDVQGAPPPELDLLAANKQSDDVNELRTNPACRIFFLSIPLLPIASSDLRQRRRNGHSIRHLVPESVDDIIRQRRLYLS